MTMNTIHLQGIGTVPATPISDLSAGDTVIWNAGRTSEILAVAKARGGMYEVRGRSDGDIWTIRKRGTTLVARITQ